MYIVYKYIHVSLNELGFCRRSACTCRCASCSPSPASSRTLLPPSRRRSPNTKCPIFRSPSTGCSLIIVFFPIFFKYSGLWPFSVFPRCQCVYTHQAGRKSGCSRTGRVRKNHKILRKKHNISWTPCINSRAYYERLIMLAELPFLASNRQK